jgi:hypothetical protein
MKKVLVMCIAVSFIATACNWFSHQPKSDPVVVTNDDTGDSLTTDSTASKTDKVMVSKDSSKNAGKKI